MAKLTARFEMEDRVSKKLRKIQNGFRALEKYRKMAQRNSAIDIRKESKTVLSTIDRIQKSIKKKLGAQTISISAEDNASTVIQKVQTQLQGLPASVSIKIGANDQATEKFERLREFVAGFKGFTIMLSAEDRVSPAVQKIQRYMETALKNGYSVTIRVIDHVMKTVGRISAGIGALTQKDNQIQLTLNDQVSKKLDELQKKIDSFGKLKTAEKTASPSAKKAESKKGEEKEGGSLWGNLVEEGKKKIKEKLDEKVTEYKEAVIDRVTQKFEKFNPEKILDDKFYALLDKVFGPEEKTPAENACCCNGLNPGAGGAAESGGGGLLDSFISEGTVGINNAIEELKNTFLKEFEHFTPESITSKLESYTESITSKMTALAEKFSPDTILAELDKFTTSFMGKVDEIATKFSPETILTELDKFTTSFMGKVDEIATKFSPETILTELDKFTTSFMSKVDAIATKFSPETILTELDKFTTSFMSKVDAIATKF
ncbi:phage portal protein, partial [Bacillus mojavensis]|nr:phage portal protein [Bacillus mojavensis]